MSDKSEGLKREPKRLRPRRRRNQEGGQSEGRGGHRGLSRESLYEEDDDYGDDRLRPVRRRRRGPKGRPPLREEVTDLNRGGAFVAAEAVALTMDVFSRVLRGVVDRAFDEDYSEPGDLVRGFANEADLAGYDLVDELRRVPSRLERRFSDGIRSPRADRGERARHEDD